METTLVHRVVKQSGPHKGKYWLTLRAEKHTFAPHGDAVLIAAAIVNLRKGDKFNKAIGDKIVQGRIIAALHDTARCVSLQDTEVAKSATNNFFYSGIKVQLRRFIERCRRYYKDTPLNLADPALLTK